tara:strand:+ start:187 stop:555 length:369 start_codon:yes stop_codon:yes gene_type:complete
MENIIDACITNNTDYDIAKVIHKILKDKYKYIENNMWEYFDDISNKWIIDIKNKNLKNAIKNDVCKEFIQRSIYWANQTKTVNSKTDIMSSKLLFIGNKMKDDKYISNIIKECKQFFITDEF